MSVLCTSMDLCQIVSLRINSQRWDFWTVVFNECLDFRYGLSKMPADSLKQPRFLTRHLRTSGVACPRTGVINPRGAQRGLHNWMGEIALQLNLPPVMSESWLHERPCWLCLGFRMEPRRLPSWSWAPPCKVGWRLGPLYATLCGVALKYGKDVTDLLCVTTFQ